MFQRNLVGLQQMQNESICEIEAKLGEQMLLKKRVRKELQKFSHKTLSSVQAKINRLKSFDTDLPKHEVLDEIEPGEIA